MSVSPFGGEQSNNDGTFQVNGYLVPASSEPPPATPAARTKQSIPSLPK
jgi:hypothetical protein